MFDWVFDVYHKKRIKKLLVCLKGLVQRKLL